MPDLDLPALQAALARRAPGDIHFRDIWPGDWDALWIGDKVKLGHAFLDAVRAGSLPGLTDCGDKAGGGRRYHWAGQG